MINITDPNEATWMACFLACLSSAQMDIDDARAAADKALAAVVERWPRDRKVITQKQHEEQIEALHEQHKSELEETRIGVMRAITGAISQAFYNEAQYSLQDRPDARGVPPALTRARP